MFSPISAHLDMMRSISEITESIATIDEDSVSKEEAVKIDELTNLTLNDNTVVNDSNAFELLRMNVYLVSQCNDVMKKCLEYLKTRSEEHIPMSNALDLRRFTSSTEENVLIADTLNAHICEHLYHFSKDARLMEFSFDNLKALLVYGRDYILPIPGSSDVPLAIIHNWVNCNREERSQCRGELMASIHSSNVSSEFLLSLIMRLEDAVDELKLSKHVHSIYELKTLIRGIDLRVLVPPSKTRGLDYFSRDGPVMEFSFEDLKELLVKAGDLMMEPEPVSSHIRLAIVHNWINRNREERRQHRRALIEIIHFSNVSPKFAFWLIKRLESAIDGVKRSKNVQPILEFETLEMGLDLGDIGGNARLNDRISLNVKNISADRVLRKYSSPHIISNLSWRISVEKEESEILFYLSCDGTDLTAKWNCYASAVLTVKSRKEAKEDFENKTSIHLFSSMKPTSVRCIEKLQFEYLMNPENGFIEDDDSITFYAWVQADVPFRQVKKIG